MSTVEKPETSDMSSCPDCKESDSCLTCKTIQNLLSRRQSASLWDFLRGICQQEEASRQFAQTADQSQKQAVLYAQHVEKRLAHAEKGLASLGQQMQKERVSMNNIQSHNTQLLAALSRSESKLGECTVNLQEETKQHSCTVERAEARQKELQSKMDVAGRSFARLARFCENIWSLSNTDAEVGDGNKRVIGPNELFLDNEMKATMFDELEERLFHTIGALNQQVRSLEEQLYRESLQRTAAVNLRDEKISELEDILEAVQEGANIRRPRSSRSRKARKVEAMPALPEARGRNANAALSDKDNLEHQA